MSWLLGLGDPQSRELGAETERLESPARLAEVRLGTSALGLGDTPSSHTSPCRSRGSADLGVVLPVLLLAVPTGRGWGPTAVGAIQSHRLGGKKWSGARDRRPEGRPLAEAGVHGVPGLGEGEGSP